MKLRNLEPKSLWNHFADLNAVPRASKKEERVIDFIVAFGKRLGLPTTVDETGNVLITKPASMGMEDRSIVALQSHLDMVHQKNEDTIFDFDSEGIKMKVDGDWVKADGTTLGADNGIGVAAIMAILASETIPHPPLEALFTIDEETGLTGAQGLKGGVLKAAYLLNLDTEDDRELTIGCAGGIDVMGTGFYKEEKTPEGFIPFRLGLKGLTGGHSGMDIHIGRGNANKLMNRLLVAGSKDFGIRIASIDGGGLRNAIPRESFSVVTVPAEREKAFSDFVISQQSILKSEYRTTDPEIQVILEKMTPPAFVMSEKDQSAFLKSVYACPNGIYRMSPDIKDLVQSSNNLARIVVGNGQFHLQCLTRSSVETEKQDLVNAVKSAFELCGATMTNTDGYPGWTPNPESSIVRLMSGIYSELFSGKPHVNACHAGLECGILGKHYPDMEMISFGPNIYGAHSPDEKVQISSVQKFWRYLLETLRRIQ
jgi:dipeptidase D